MALAIPLVLSVISILISFYAVRVSLRAERREQENQARRAHIEIVRVNGSSWEQIQQHHGDVQISLSAGTLRPNTGTGRLAFSLRNTGAITLLRPTFLFAANPNVVFVDQADMPAGRTNHHILQMSGLNISDVFPYSQTGTDYAILTDVNVPNGVPNFDLSFRVIGENLDAPWERVFHISVTPPQQQ